MSLVNQLVSSVRMSQLMPLKAQEADQDVLENFYVCWLAMMADAGLSVGYHDFVAKTRDEAKHALQSGDVMLGTQDFLANHHHQKLAQTLAQHAFVDEALVANLMPLLVHHGMTVLSTSGKPHDIAHIVYPEIRKRLPNWAATVLPQQALSPSKVISVDPATVDNAVDALVMDAQSFGVSAPTQQPVSVDALMGDELAKFDEFFETKEADNSALELAADNEAQTDELVFALPDEFLANSPQSSDDSQQSNDVSIADHSAFLTPIEFDTSPAALELEQDVGQTTEQAPSVSVSVPAFQPKANHQEQAIHALQADSAQMTDTVVMQDNSGLAQPSQSFSEPAKAQDTNPPAQRAEDNPFAYNDVTPTNPDPNSVEPHNTDPSVTESEEESDAESEGQPTARFAKNYSGIQPKKRTTLNPLAVGIPVLLLALLGGAGAWYVLKNKNQNQANPAEAGAVTAAIPTTTAKPTSRLNITVDDKGGLYACQAELGTSELQAELMAVLNGSFNATTCVLDINDSFSGAIVGMDRLSGVIALLKSKRFASLEMSNNKILIHAPNGDDMAWLIKEISALLSGSQIEVAGVPPHNRDLATQESHARAKEALTALPNGTGGFALARAMSLPIVEFDADGNITPASQEMLNLGANHLKANPDVRLIVAAHTSQTAESSQDLLLTQRRADAVRSHLIAQGVSEGQLVAQGVGSRFPVADNETELGRFKNNRVEFLEYSEAIMQALSPPTAPAITMGNQDLDRGGVYYSAEAQPAQNLAPSAPVVQPPIQGVPQPVYGVQNGQIVEEIPYVPQPVAPATPAPTPTVHIDDDLLRPIGSDAAQGAPAIHIDPQ